MRIPAFPLSWAVDWLDLRTGGREGRADRAAWAAAGK